MNKYLYLLFFRFKYFLRSSRYFPRLSYRLTFVMLNVGMVDNLEFWWTVFEFRGPNKYVFLSEVSHRAVLKLFFALARAFAKTKAKTTLLVLWLFTSNISPHFAEFAGMKLKIISARYILTALLLKFTKSGKIYCCWTLQLFIHS